MVGGQVSVCSEGTLGAGCALRFAAQHDPSKDQVDRHDTIDQLVLSSSYCTVCQYELLRHSSYSSGGITNSHLIAEWMQCRIIGHRVLDGTIPPRVMFHFQPWGPQSLECVSTMTNPILLRLGLELHQLGWDAASPQYSPLLFDLLVHLRLARPQDERAPISFASVVAMGNVQNVTRPLV
ncbi:hypothetical protein L228DRAFT_23764 [Xylona heveae TC161]|uniref:Uncharacterized protein n=1 Tax=Xylona heveae (strain CBS 132557 / TC161) TaxID=1328760 RepID=A0A165AAN2_XYLHT|nr:hypothetical protein L228DRAFT_23764 [Xylona heveae TC161]KZF20180.1 hypothetical protein L228DRAFT_23764 [Xylona heveae TC161]